jgi:hypothetical protein
MSAFQRVLGWRISEYSFGVMKKLPTDRQVLCCIFEMYATAYPGPVVAGGRGTNDPYVPIDVTAVAGRLGCTPELIFGRLYYHLDAKHRYKQDNGVLVGLFDLNFQNKGHSVHFPYLVSILAGLEEEHRKLFWSMAFSTAALIVSVISLAASIATKWM